MRNKIPVNIFMGFLGSGKTTIIMNLLDQMPERENVVWLKNEYGDVSVDDLLLKKTHVKVAEMLNGCICCVLVGKLQNALEEIVKKYNPVRIIIESSGTAFPGPVVWEVNKINTLYVDSVINVIDVENFAGIRDRSFTAEIQNKAIDLIVFNKYPKLTEGSKEESDIEYRLDDVYELNPTTPKLKSTDGKINKDLLLGLSERTITTEELEMLGKKAEDEVDEHKTKKHHDDDPDTYFLNFESSTKFDKSRLEIFLRNLDRKQFFRIKGPVRTNEGDFFINYVLGKYELTKLENYKDKSLIIFMGKLENYSQEKMKNDLNSLS